MALRVHQLEERWVRIDLIAGADNSDITVPRVLERKRVREVCLVDPCTLISDTFGLKAAVTQSHVRSVFNDHVRTSG